MVLKRRKQSYADPLLASVMPNLRSPQAPEALSSDADKARGVAPTQLAPDPRRKDVESNGALVAIVLASAIAAACMGMTTLAAAAFPGAREALTFFSASGSLSGKAIITTTVFAVAVALLVPTLRGRTIAKANWLPLAVALWVVGLLGTFPPVFEAVAHVLS
jgi:hypothetical protein